MRAAMQWTFEMLIEFVSFYHCRNLLCPQTRDPSALASVLVSFRNMKRSHAIIYVYSTHVIVGSAASSVRRISILRRQNRDTGIRIRRNEVAWKRTYCHRQMRPGRVLCMEPRRTKTTGSKVLSLIRMTLTGNVSDRKLHRRCRSRRSFC